MRLCLPDTASRSARVANSLAYSRTAFRVPPFASFTAQRHALRPLPPSPAISTHDDHLDLHLFKSPFYITIIITSIAITTHIPS